MWCANGLPAEIAGDQRPDDARSLCFASEALAEPLEILGYPRLHLRVKTDRPLALVAARLEDVATDGSSLLVSWGLLNLTHARGHERAEPLVVDEWYDVQLECRVCAHRFAPGHRLRLALSPTYWPQAWPSPQTVTLTIALGSSLVELPVRGSAGPFGLVLETVDGREGPSRDGQDPDGVAAGRAAPARAAAPARPSGALSGRGASSSTRRAGGTTSSTIRRSSRPSPTAAPSIASEPPMSTA